MELNILPMTSTCHETGYSGPYKRDYQEKGDSDLMESKHRRIHLGVYVIKSEVSIWQSNMSKLAIRSATESKALLKESYRRKRLCRRQNRAAYSVTEKSLDSEAKDESGSAYPLHIFVCVPTQNCTRAQLTHKGL